MNSKSVTLILASQSPRRAQLLAEAGFHFHILTPDEEVEEQARKILTPNELVLHLAEVKAANVVHKLHSQNRLVHDRLASFSPTSEFPNEIFVVGADTIAHCQGQILGKPVDVDDARKMLSLMSGQKHSVLTGVSLWHLNFSEKNPAMISTQGHIERLETTTLLMDPLSDEQLDEFLATDGWKGKAGAFGYQDGLDWVHITNGLASNVVGLPVERIEDWITELRNSP